MSDETGRMRLRSAALIVAALIAAGTMTPPGPQGFDLLGTAHADDDDDWDDDDWDDDDDDDDDDRPVIRRRAAPPPAPPPVPLPDFVPDELVVVDVDDAAVTRIQADGFTLVARSAVGVLQSDLARFRIPGGIALSAARDRLQALVPNALVDFNHLYRPNQGACRGEACRWFDMVGWSAPPGACAAAPTIGMIDTKVNPDHPSLEGQKVEIVRVVEQTWTESSAVHGTAIAVLFAGRSDSRTPGLLPNASLVAVEAFHSGAAGSDSGDVYDIVRAIDLLAARDVDVINLSFAGPANPILERVAQAASASGVALVAAAGNEGPRAEPRFPAAYGPVIAVTAVDHDRRVYRQAGRGEHIDFAAPGVQLWTAASISGGRPRSGTSYAAPFVTASLAAMRVADRDAPVEGLLARLQERSLDLGEPGRDPVFGWGLVQMGDGCDEAAAYLPAAAE